TLTLNITNSTGYIVNSSQQAFTLERNTTTQRNFTNINTTAWSEGIYALNAYLVYGSYTDNRAESIVLGSVKAHAQSDTYACEGNTTEFTVIVYHPFTDTISYNVTLDTPGWGYTPAWQQINATSAKNYTVSFNITPGSTTENITAVVNYTYPGSIQKSVEDNKTIEASASTSVLEIIRETPGILAADRVFSSRLVVHNKGCAATIGTTTLMEIVGSGWTPANPAVLGDVQEISSTVDLENNLVTWQLGQIQPKQYAIAAYQMKSPPTYPTTGTLNWNVSWESKQMQEASLFRMQTFNYTGESHISFDMEAWQKDEYPWTENRSMQPNITYNFSLKTRNVGDTQVSSGQWNVTLTIPASCNVTETTGSWNSTSSMITWELPALAVRSTEYLNFTLNCTLDKSHVLTATATRDTRNSTSYYNQTDIGCVGATCTAESAFTFSNPGEHYERLSEIDFGVFYNWSGDSLTIGEGYLNISDDNSKAYDVWRAYSLQDASGLAWANYTFDETEKWQFRDTEHAIGIYSHSDAKTGETGNVTLQEIYYYWNYGIQFNEPEDLFMISKVYVYIPLMENPQVAPSEDGWGNQFNFSVDVRDRFGRNITVYAWHRKAGDPAYTLIGTDICIDCASWNQINFSSIYYPENISTWEYKFNATNDDGGKELSGESYIIEKDDVSVYNITAAWNATVMRSSAFNFTMQMWDDDNNTAPSVLEFGKGFFRVSQYASNTSYNTYYPESPVVNNTGHMFYEMATSEWCDAAKSYVLGQNYYITGLSGSTYYKDNSTQPEPHNAIPFRLIGNLSQSSMSTPDGSSNYTRGTSIPLDGTIQDDCSGTKSDNAKYGAEYVMSSGGTNYSVVA
ncbi:MAG: hypothetical protein KAJ24_05330, partial [Candidatus Aenigmarchaeota archaeon]|nr:hypothetical protein [Candidatus Aenigmarchaeota archaeon]